MSASATHSNEPPPSTSSHPSDHVNLRVTYLHGGNPRPPHNVGVIPASTTVGDLKSRLQNDLLEHPRTEEQRLIYQGRPLMQNHMSLKEALRLEEPIGPLPYTIHIIFQPRQASAHYRPPQAPQIPQQPPLNPNGQPHINPMAAVGLEQHRRALQMVMANLAQVQQNLTAHLPPNIQTQVHVNGIPVDMRQGQQPLSNFETIQQGVGNYPPVPLPPQFNAPAHTQNPYAYLPGAHNMPNPAAPHNLQLPLQAPPFQRPSSAPGDPRHRQTASAAARIPPAGIPGQRAPGPALPTMPIHNTLPFPFQQSMPVQSQPTQPTVWLASSRNGPEALLFAPGHGFYSSRPQPTYHHPIPTRTTQVPVTTANATTTNPAAPPVANAANGQVAIRPPNADAQPRARRRHGPQIAADDGIWTLVIQRAWLFLRLYMFIYVLSESGTWRRYGLLFFAAIVCLLPRENPFNDVLVAARHHLDNLIGPPQPQPRPRTRDAAGRPRPQGTAEQVQAAGQAEQQGAERNVAATANGPVPLNARIPGAVNVTPDEAATRLVRQHREQNPNILRDAFYRIEQAVALFLASLVPGVGERHVAAREEARREEERVRVEAQRLGEEEEKKKQAEKDAAKAGEQSQSREGEQPTTSDSVGERKGGSSSSIDAAAPSAMSQAESSTANDGPSSSSRSHQDGGGSVS